VVCYLFFEDAEARTAMCMGGIYSKNASLLSMQNQFSVFEKIRFRPGVFILFILKSCFLWAQNFIVHQVLES